MGRPKGFSIERNSAGLADGVSGRTAGREGDNVGGGPRCRQHRLTRAVRRPSVNQAARGPVGRFFTWTAVLRRFAAVKKRRWQGGRGRRAGARQRCHHLFFMSKNRVVLCQSRRRINLAPTQKRGGTGRFLPACGCYLVFWADRGFIPPVPPSRRDRGSGSSGYRSGYRTDGGPPGRFPPC